MIFIIAEHRNDTLRDITFQSLEKGRILAKKMNFELAALVLEGEQQNYEDILACYADRVICVRDERLKNFNSEVYQRVLVSLCGEYQPKLIIMGHTSYGIELAPSLAVALNYPIATDCVDIDAEGNDIIIRREIYGGKLYAQLSFMDNIGVVTLQPSVFKGMEKASTGGKIIKSPMTINGDLFRKNFIEYVRAPEGDIDITSADKIISIGRGVKKVEDLILIEDLAKSIGATIACSRAIVDKGWLPIDRQVGSSGRTVHPRLYVAIGISGAAQHLAGMRGSETIIAINEDSEAPIMSIAHYAIIDDLYKAVPLIKEKCSQTA